MNKSLLLAMAASISLSGCAAVGTGLELAGNLSGQKTLANAGKSVARTAEVEEFGPEEKYYTGRTVAAQLLQGEKPSDSTDLEAYVGRVGNSVALASGLGELPQGWHFILLEGDEPNAYACPGGLIFVSKGLVKLCESEDELAGVLAHEVAHIALDHPMSAISAANKKAALVSLAQFGVEQYAQNNNLKDLTQSFNGVVKEVGKAVSHGYDRSKESEADKAAVGMLTELGYDPRGLKRVLERLKAGDKSHGDPKKRAEAVDKEAFDNEPVPSVLSARTKRFKEAVKWVMYLALKYLHIVMAIFAIGANFTYAIWFSLAEKEPKNFLFALKGVERIDKYLANPCYMGLSVTGPVMIWMSGWPWSQLWVWGSLTLLVLLSVLGVAVYSPLLRRQIALAEAGDLKSQEFQALHARAKLLGRVMGVLVLAVVYLMVIKPV